MKYLIIGNNKIVVNFYNFLLTYLCEILDNMINLIFEVGVTTNNRCTTCNHENIKNKRPDTVNITLTSIEC